MRVMEKEGKSRKGRMGEWEGKNSPGIAKCEKKRIS